MADRRVPRWAWSAAFVAMAMLSAAILVLPLHPGAGGLLGGFGLVIFASARLVLAWRQGW